MTKNVVASFVRDASGNVAVTKVDYSLDSTTILFDTGATGSYGTGILDTEAQFTGTDGVAVTFNVNGVATTQVVKAYSTDTLMNGDPNNGGTSLTFSTNASGQTVALNGSACASVSAACRSGQVGTADGNSTEAGRKLPIPTLAVVLLCRPTMRRAAVTANAGFSTSDLDITDLSTVADNMGAGFTASDALDFMIQYVDSTLAKMTSAAASLGSMNSRIDLQTTFVSKLMDSIDKGVGKLVDADMEAESSKLTALQTQQQLAVQSLSIANSSSQNILSLFK